MSSLIPGYEYDIFISYRQKDNKGDRWVSKFVESLKTELEATFKEDVSVYFDENPHDRLQDTHDVDKSLESKLRCLIFIPILSQTYCDANSYAWRREFLAFLQAVKTDPFGKDVKLRGGNVASRVLPIRIHELEQEDIKLYEKETGSVLRALDFVFRTASGVNRPLLPEDNKNDNLNKSLYRDQVNKVAGAVKEIILGMKEESSNSIEEKVQANDSISEVSAEKIKKKPAKVIKTRFLISISAIVLLIIAGIIAYPKIFKRDNLERLRSSGERISVAVMPFQNMTNDTIWNVWQEGIQDIMINFLSGSKELIVRQTESMVKLIDKGNDENYSALTQSLASKISRKLGTDVFLYGSIIQAGSVIRLNARLIDSRTEEVYNPFQVEGPAEEEKAFTLIKSLCRQVNDFLLVSVLKRETVKDNLLFTYTNSPDALRYFNYGFNAYLSSDFVKAEELLSKAVAIDSGFTSAVTRLAYTSFATGKVDQVKKLCRLAYSKRDQMSESERIWTNYTYARWLQTPKEQLRYIMQLLELDDQMPYYNWIMGDVYARTFQYDKAIPPLEKALKIFEKWKLKPYSRHFYGYLLNAYRNTGQYDKALKLLRAAEKDYPEGFINERARLYLSKGDTIKANRYIEKIKSVRKERNSEAEILNLLAGIYSDAGVLDKAEDCYQKVISLEPQSDIRKYNLATFLIDKDRDIPRGLEIIGQLLEKYPDNYGGLFWEGYGLYKQGKYEEAFEILSKSWDLRLKYYIYDHKAFQVLEAAKKAAAGQPNN